MKKIPLSLLILLSLVFIIGVENISNAQSAIFKLAEHPELKHLDSKAEFPGGKEAMYQYLANKIDYPKIALNKVCNGKEIIIFDVGIDGVIENIQVLQDVEGNCGEAAIKAVKDMPIWKPGLFDGMPIRVTYKLTINFDAQISDWKRFMEADKEKDTVKKNYQFVWEDYDEQEDYLKYDVVEKDPEFPGGLDALYQFLTANIRYPAIARDNNIQGKVYITFVVDIDGSIKNPRVLKDIGGGCGQEALRVIKLMPKWIPGENDGEAVRVQVNLPINFNLQSAKENHSENTPSEHVLCQSANGNFSAKTPNGHVLYYTITSSNRVEVVPQNSQTPRYSNLSGDLIIPEKISYNGQEYTVTAIGERAFLGCDNVSTVSLPESILYIKDYAFWGCSKLTDINIPSSVTSIGNYSFGRCFSLKKLVVPNKVSTIGKMAFVYVSNIEYTGNASKNKPWGAQKINGVVQNGTQSTSGSSTTNPQSTTSNNSQSSTTGNSASAHQKRNESPRVGRQNNNAKISRIELTEQYIIVHLLVPSSTDKKATYRVSSGTILVPDLPEYNDIVSKVTRKSQTLEKANLILDQGDLMELQAMLIQNSNNPYFTYDIIKASKETIKYGADMRDAFDDAGLLVVSAGNEELDTEYKLYSKSETSWHFTMYFRRNALPVGCSRFTIREIRVSNKNPKYWQDISYEMPCPYHTKEYSNTTESAIEQTIDNENDGIVGIYEDVSDGGNKVGVVKYGTSYRIIYISGSNNRCWETGHVKAELRPTATTGLFKGKWYMTDFSENNSCMVTFDGMKMDIVVDDQRMMFIKMYPTQGSSSATITNAEKWSGTGWALGKGYLVTNHHVVDGARTITIKGVDGDLNTGYSADVVATDKINDIAILKINDNIFKGFGNLPYSVSPRIADVGEDIFVLGWPLGQDLGDEIKLTTGIINSRTGAEKYQNCYQIQAPITNGNSGGPVFDSKGNVIGIVVAGLNKELNLAENVGYAIKTSYLKILIESVGLNISFPNNNTISTMSRPEKVKKVRNFVYYIECSK